MSDPVLHIKDSYYFEVPKPLYPARYEGKNFPNVWVKNDEQFQEWEAERLYHRIQELAGDNVKLPDEHGLIHDWQHWQHEAPNHGNFAKPLDVYSETLANRFKNDYRSKTATLRADAPKPAYDEYLAKQEADGAEGVWAARLLEQVDKKEWAAAKQYAGGKEAIAEFK